MRITYVLCSLSFIVGLGTATIINDFDRKTEVKVFAEEVEPVDIEPPVVYVDRIVYPEPETVITDAEKILMAKVVYAEAGNQDFIGKQLVADTILNRMYDPAFPDTVSGVIYQKDQFARPANYLDMECLAAVNAECEKRLDPDVLWFCNYAYLPYGKPAYQHGAHYFCWRAEK